MRQFIAVELPQTVQNEIEQAVNPLKESLKNILWTPRQNLHLTLKFLGEVTQDQVLQIQACMKDVVQEGGFKSFLLKFSDFGGFPSLQHLRILWLGVLDGQEILQRLAIALDQRLEGLGFAQEKREYRPHLTLGRSKNQKTLHGITRDALIRKTSFAGFSVNMISLVQSFLSKNGAIYQRVCEVKLN